MAWASCVGCSGGERHLFLEAAWAEDSTVVVVALGSDGRPDQARSPSVISGEARFVFDQDGSASVDRVVFLEFLAGSRAALGIARCGVAMLGAESRLPSPIHSFHLQTGDDAPKLVETPLAWGDHGPRFADCTPTACDSVTVSSGSLVEHATWRIQGITRVHETRVLVRLSHSSTIGPGLLLLVERPDEVVRAIEGPVQMSGAVRIGDALLLTAQDGALYRSDLELSELIPTGTVSPNLGLSLELDGRSAIGFTYHHSATYRVHGDGRAGPAPLEFRHALHELVFGPDGRAAGIRTGEKAEVRDNAVAVFDGSNWTRIPLPREADGAEDVVFEGSELIVAGQKAVFELGSSGSLQQLEQVPGPIGRNFSSLARLGQGYVLGGHTGLLQRFDRTSFCTLPSGNNESIDSLIAMSPSTIVGGWKFSRTETPQLIWVDDALPNDP